MNYDESVFKEKANRKARKIWLIFAILLSANYGSDVANGLRTGSYYFVFLLLCWLPILIGAILLRIKGFTTELYRYAIEIDIISHVIAKSNGIDNETINVWGNNDSKLSTLSFGIYKKLSQFREESLSNKLVTGNKNPVGVIAVLNRQYGWASPYTSDSNRQKKALTDAELPKLGGSNCAKSINNSEVAMIESDG